MIKGLHHISVYARNAEESLNFYINTLGFELIDKEDCSFGQFCLVGLNNCRVELITPPEGADHVNWEIGEKESVLSHFGMDVDDIDTVYADLVAKGVKVRSKGIEVLERPLDGGRVFSIFGPSGEVINFYQFQRAI